MSINFSQQSEPRKRHLQCKDRNSLFPDANGINADQVETEQTGRGRAGPPDAASQITIN